MSAQARCKSAENLSSSHFDKGTSCASCSTRLAAAHLGFCTVHGFSCVLQLLHGFLHQPAGDFRAASASFLPPLLLTLSACMQQADFTQLQRQLQAATHVCRPL